MTFDLEVTFNMTKSWDFLRRFFHPNLVEIGQDGAKLCQFLKRYGRTPDRTPNGSLSLPSPLVGLTINNTLNSKYVKTLYRWWLMVEGTSHNVAMLRGLKGYWGKITSLEKKSRDLKSSQNSISNPKRKHSINVHTTKSGYTRSKILHLNDVSS